MYTAKKNLIVVCEGNSENAYIQELNRFLDDNDYPFTFIPKPIHNGHYKPTIIKYEKTKKDNKHSDIIIWVDKDTYLRNDENDRNNYNKKPKKIPDFNFSCLNFEDFLVMHLDEKYVLEWQEICEKHLHFEKPMHSAEYMPLLTANIFPTYKKGQIPFEITQEQIDNLFKNQQNPKIKFKCDFVSFILSEMKRK